MKNMFIIVMTVLILTSCTNKVRKIDLHEECKYAAPDAILYNPHNCLQFLSGSSCKYDEGGVLKCQN